MKKLMAANWKMFKTGDEAHTTAGELVRRLEGLLPKDREVLIIPPFTALTRVRDAISKTPGVFLGAQNFYPADQGAYTGEIAPKMLLDAGCVFALAGHSERRHILGESSGFVGQKVAFGLSSGLKMILCVGEKLEERKSGNVEKILKEQLEVGLKDVDQNVSAKDLSIAYEPVWAIGTGEVAGPEEIVHAHGFVRQILKQIFPDQGADIRILYGGSVNPENCAGIIALDNVEGVLVGGASLKADSFGSIVTA